MTKKHVTEQSIVFRIYTEDKDEQEVIRLAAKHGFSGLSLIRGTGVWEFEKENCLIIEIIADYYRKHDLITLAGEIKKFNEQTCILVTHSNIFAIEL